MFTASNLCVHISKSVFRYCKVSFYPPNINIVLFYRKYTNIDTDVQYQEIYTDIQVLSVFFSIIMKTLKNIFSLHSNAKKCCLLCLSSKKDHATPCLFVAVIALYWKDVAWHAMLACCC